jgi:hypothetical protein
MVPRVFAHYDTLWPAPAVGAACMPHFGMYAIPKAGIKARCSASRERRWSTTRHLLRGRRKRSTTEGAEATEKNSSPPLCELCGLCGEPLLGLRLHAPFTETQVLSITGLGKRISGSRAMWGAMRVAGQRGVLRPR